MMMMMMMMMMRLVKDCIANYTSHALATVHYEQLMWLAKA